MATLRKMATWPFQNFTNFTLTSVGFFGVGFVSYSIYSQNKFNQPIIAEAIKLLGKHTTVKELVGYPLAYNFSISNRFIQKQGESYFSFEVRGPKSNINVEMAVSAKPAKQVYSYGQPNQRLDTLNSQITAFESRLGQIEQEMKKARQKQKQALQLEKVDLTSKLQAYRDELVEVQYDVEEKKRKFFVPNKQLYTSISSPKAWNNEEQLDKQEMLWGINDLVITLPNRTKMIVYPETKKSLTQKREALQKEEYPQTPTIKSMSRQVSMMDLKEFSKEEIEAYGKQKVQFMYSSYTSYRLVTFLFFFSTLFAVIMYKRRTAMRTIKGSVLEAQVKKVIDSNPHLNALLKAKKKTQPDFQDLVGGGISDGKFNCVMYLRSLTNGRVEFSGEQSEETGRFKLDKLQLKYIQNKEKKVVDLLA